MSRDILQLKRYANRKIYNPETHGYVTLKQIKESIISGRNIKVTDYVTKVVLTEKTLFDILHLNNPNLTDKQTESLHDLIRNGLFKE